MKNYTIVSLQINNKKDSMNNLRLFIESFFIKL